MNVFHLQLTEKPLNAELHRQQKYRINGKTLRCQTSFHVQNTCAVITRRATVANEKSTTTTYWKEGNKHQRPWPCLVGFWTTRRSRPQMDMFSSLHFGKYDKLKIPICCTRPSSSWMRCSPSAPPWSRSPTSSSPCASCCALVTRPVETWCPSSLPPEPVRPPFLEKSLIKTCPSEAHRGTRK